MKKNLIHIISGLIMFYNYYMTYEILAQMCSIPSEFHKLSNWIVGALGILLISVSILNILKIFVNEKEKWRLKNEN